MRIIEGCISSKNKEIKEEKEEEKKNKTEKIIEYNNELYVKSMETKRRLDLGFKVSKIPSGIEFKTMSGVETCKNRNYKKIDGDKILEKLPEEEIEKEKIELLEKNNELDLK